MASYRKTHIKNKIHKIRPRRSIFKRLWFWLVLLFLIVVLSVFYFVFFYSGFQLKNIVISGNNKAGTQDLRNLVLNDANTGLINFWDIKVISRSIFLVDDGKINKDILEKFPVIGQVTISKNLPQTLVLGVIERKPVGVYCPSTGENDCFLIDENGIIYEPLSTSPDNLTIVRQTTENSQVFTGEEVVSQNIISAISKIQKNLKDNFQIDLKEALITSPVRLNVKTNENWQVYFDLEPNSDINLQLTKLNLLLNGGISADSRKNLRYIDLRPEDRAIICDNKICGGK